MHNSPVTFELYDEEAAFPAVRLDRIDVFTTLKNPTKRVEHKSLFI